MYRDEWASDLIVTVNCLSKPSSLGPMHPISQGADAPTPKKQRHVMTLEEKVKVLDLLQEGMSYASVGKRYGVNESSVRTIKKNETKIRQTFHVVTPSAGKYTSYVRDRKVAKMESALAIWIQDQHRKGNPTDNSSIKSKASSLYNKMQTTTEPDEPSTSTAPEPSTSVFTASKGWFENFKKRVGIHNVKITGEGRSADHATATAFPSSFQKIIKAKGTSQNKFSTSARQACIGRGCLNGHSLLKKKKSTRFRGSQRSMHIDSLLQCCWRYDKTRFHLQVTKSTCTKAPE